MHWSDQEKELLPIVILGNKADDEYEYKRCPEVCMSVCEYRCVQAGAVCVLNSTAFFA